MLSEEGRQRLREAGRKGGKAKVPKGFAVNPNTKEISRKALDVRWHKKQP